MFDFFAFLPHAVPKIVFSVAAWLLALFVLRDVLPIYGTIWILVPVYVVATLSYGTRMINGALIQIHRELEESAMVSGRRPCRRPCAPCCCPCCGRRCCMPGSGSRCCPIAS